MFTFDRRPSMSPHFQSYQQRKIGFRPCEGKKKDGDERSVKPQIESWTFATLVHEYTHGLSVHY